MDTRETVNCERFREDLISRLDGEWVPTGDCDPLPEEMRAHARVCPRCARVLAAFDLLAGGGDSVSAPPGLANRLADSFPATDRVSGGSLARWGAGLAAAAVLVIASVFVTTVVLQREAPVVASAPATTSPQEIDSAPATTFTRETDSAPPIDSAPETAPSASDGRPPTTVVVRLELAAPAAESVAVVGDWNGWDPRAHPLSERNSTGLWEIEIEILSGEEYRYQFLVDGEQWIPDPEAPITVSDGFGGTNSVLNI
jgi:hypothetical protein